MEHDPVAYRKFAVAIWDARWSSSIRWLRPWVHDSDCRCRLPRWDASYGLWKGRRETVIDVGIFYWGTSERKKRWVELKKLLHEMGDMKKTILTFVFTPRTLQSSLRHFERSLFVLNSFAQHGVVTLLLEDVIHDLRRKIAIKIFFLSVFCQILRCKAKGSFCIAHPNLASRLQMNCSIVYIVLTCCLCFCCLFLALVCSYLLSVFLQFVLGVGDFADSRVERHVDVVVLRPHVVRAALQSWLDASKYKVGIVDVDIIALLQKGHLLFVQLCMVDLIS